MNYRFFAVFFLALPWVSHAQTADDYLGTWALVQQVSATPVGQIIHPFANTLITIGQTELVEDYSQLQTSLSQCSSTGLYRTPLTLTATGPVLDSAKRLVEQEPNISCSPTGTSGLGGTNAVPLSLTIPTWQWTLKDNTLTAVIQLGPNTTTQTYQRTTFSTTTLSTEQQTDVKDQLETDLKKNTTVTINAPDQTLRLTREIGLRTKAPELIGELTISGQVDRTVLGQAVINVLVTIYSTPIVKIAQVDEAGAWTLTVPAELLSAGEHTVYAAVESAEIKTDQVEVTKFVVEERIRLSNTTWLIIVNGAIVILVIMIVLLQRFRSAAHAKPARR